jgi:predicted oxidoreductase
LDSPQRFLPVLGADEMGKMDNQMKATNEALDEQRKIYKAIQTGKSILHDDIPDSFRFKQ